MERPHHHLAFLAMLLLGVWAGVAGTAGASYPSSDPAWPSHERPAREDADAAAPASRPSATLPAPPRSGAGGRRSPGRTPPCDRQRLALRITEGCAHDEVSPTAPCCAPLLAAGRAGTDCFCSMLETQTFLTMGMISARGAVDMYYKCGGRHHVAFCL